METNHQKWPVDAHVHFHAFARAAQTLDSAAANFQTVGGRRDGLVGALLLAQASDERVFETLRETAGVGAWRLAPARDEAETLVAHRDAERIAIVCGRQVRTEGGLEVLGLGTGAEFPDRLPLPEAVRAVQASGALTVLPWGFGKWLGQRGRRVAALLDDCRAGKLFVGDNGGRMRALPLPAGIRKAESNGIIVLRGSDPFPIVADHRRAGAFGFFAEMPPPESAPWRALRDWLLARRQSPQPYGRACGLVRFTINQVGIQLYRKRLSART